jgi:two-component system, cell cycle response regulator DivK
MAGERILVVDDNAANVKLASFVLKARGYEVRVASNAEEAMEEITGHRPKLILMDVQMPGTDGLTLTRLLKAAPETKDLIIVAFTAYAMEGDAQRAREAGCDGYLSKPIDTRIFAEQVAAFLTASG